MTGSVGVACPKCGYKRKKIDAEMNAAPDGQCPSCGFVYAKFDPVPNQGSARATIPRDSHAPSLHSGAQKGNATDGSGSPSRGRSWGSGACSLGVLMLILSVSSHPPKFESLQENEVTVTQAPFLKDSLENPWSNFQMWWKAGFNKASYESLKMEQDRYTNHAAAIGVNGSTMWLAHDTLEIPKELANIKYGDGIKIWWDSSKNAIWQVAAREGRGDYKTIYSYEQSTKEDASQRKFELICGTVILIVGVVLFFVM